MKFYPIDSRRYGAHVPRKLPKKPALVVALHSGALTPEVFEAMTDWSDLADLEKFVVVYPEGVGRSWNAGHGALGKAGRHGVDDRGFLDFVIGDALRRWKCDPKRVFLSGHSNASMLAHWYACVRQSSVVAFAGVSGGFSRLPTDGLGHGFVPCVRMVHGTEDRHTPFGGGVGPDAYDKYDHLPIEQTASWWRGQGAEITTVWHSGGHEWPDGETRAQWEFFRGVGP